MSKISTAKEYMQKKMGVTTSSISGLQTYLKDDVERSLIEFARLHVKAALQEAYNRSNVTHGFKDAILNAYPPENIK